jgi:hypothetical protein
MTTTRGINEVTSLVLDRDVALVHRVHLGKRSELHAYFQPFNGELKAHLRQVNIRQDGTVSYTGKGVAVQPEQLTELLEAVALLAVNRQALDGPPE